MKAVPIRIGIKVVKPMQVLLINKIAKHHLRKWENLQVNPPQRRRIVCKFFYCFVYPYPTINSGAKRGVSPFSLGK